MGCQQSTPAKDGKQPGGVDKAALLESSTEQQKSSPDRKGSVVHKSPEFESVDTGTPFDPAKIGTLTRHGIAPARLANATSKAKINQDRGMVCWPFNGTHDQALLCVFDGHGMQGERISEWCVQQIPQRLEGDRQLLNSSPAECLSKHVRAR